MATVIPTTGVPFEVTPANGKAFTLPELQETVHGYIEALRAPDGRLMYVNEDGKNLGLPMNHAATALMRPIIGPNDYIVGPVILCTRIESGEDREDDDDLSDLGIIVLD